MKIWNFRFYTNFHNIKQRLTIYENAVKTLIKQFFVNKINFLGQVTKDF